MSSADQSNGSGIMDSFDDFPDCPHYDPKAADKAEAVRQKNIETEVKRSNAALEREARVNPSIRGRGRETIAMLRQTLQERYTL